MMQFLSFLMFILLFIIVLYWNRDELRDYLERDRLIGPYVEDSDEQKSFNHTDRVLEGVFRRVRFEAQFSRHLPNPKKKNYLSNLAPFSRNCPIVEFLLQLSQLNFSFFV
jgi:hypothetical protein